MVLHDIKKAARIISDFTEAGKSIQNILLNFELSKEGDKKCGYGWPEGQEPKRMNPEEELKIIMEKALQRIKKIPFGLCF